MSAAYNEAKTLFDTFKASFDAKPCDLKKCEEQLAKLKLAVFKGLSCGSLIPGGNKSADAGKEQLLARDALELACKLSLRLEDKTGFERHVAQLKMYYNDPSIPASENKFPIIGLYLFHLLASDRIGEFHTEIELIHLDDYENQYIKHPMQLERYMMEGNYEKVLELAKVMPQKDASFFVQRLDEVVRHKVGASLERSYEYLPAQEAAKMLVLNDVAALQEFALKENERKAREEMAEETLGDMTPSLTRRAPIGLVRWEVKDGKLHFARSTQKQLEIPALDIMTNTIGYATDLERIV